MRPEETEEALESTPPAHIPNEKYRALNAFDVLEYREDTSPEDIVRQGIAIPQDDSREDLLAPGSPLVSVRTSVVDDPTYARYSQRYSLDAGVRLAGEGVRLQRTPTDYSDGQSSQGSTLPPPYQPYD